jgi:hypothetical protein
MVEPFLSGIEIVILFELSRWNFVEQPHALIGHRYHSIASRCEGNQTSQPSTDVSFDIRSHIALTSTKKTRHCLSKHRTHCQGSSATRLITFKLDGMQAQAAFLLVHVR